MIKAEVVFDGDVICVGTNKIIVDFEEGEFFLVINGKNYYDTTIEQAIQYCMEN